MDKIIEYHVSHRAVFADSESFTFRSQLYQVGVYAIITNSNGRYSQFNLTPKNVADIEKKLNKKLKLGEIKELEYGRLIRVKEVNGLYEEVL